MNQDILISVIIPVYNILDCLEKCVHSVINQTYQNLDIILIDDGSTDGTADLCDDLSECDNRIRVFHKQNGGSSSARNLGIRQAKGDYIGFVDSDDFIDEKMYETLLCAILNHNLKMAQISRDEIDHNGNKLADVCIPPKKEIIQTDEEILTELLLHRGDCSFCTRLTHRDLFQNRSFPEGKLNEDFFLLTSMLNEVKKIVILPQQYYHVFYRIGSNTRKENKEDFPQVFTDIVDNATAVKNIVDNYYPRLKKVCTRFNLYQRLDYLLHIPISRMKKENIFYCQVVKYLRKNFTKMITNPYLTAKNKIYLLLLTIAPRTTRIIHAKWKHLS